MITTERYGVLPDGRPVQEVTQWMPVSDNDPRGVELPGQDGRWIVAGISNPLGTHGASPVSRGEYDTASQIAQVRLRTLQDQARDQRRAQVIADRQQLLDKGVSEEVIQRLVGPDPTTEDIRG